MDAGGREATGNRDRWKNIRVDKTLNKGRHEYNRGLSKKGMRVTNGFSAEKRAKVKDERVDKRGNSGRRKGLGVEK